MTGSSADSSAVSLHIFLFALRPWWSIRQLLHWLSVLASKTRSSGFSTEEKLSLYEPLPCNPAAKLLSTP